MRSASLTVLAPGTVTLFVGSTNRISTRSGIRFTAGTDDLIASGVWLRMIDPSLPRYGTDLIATECVVAHH